MRASIPLATILLLCASALALADTDEWCRNGAGQFERTLGSYRLRIEPARDGDGDSLCRAVVTTRTGEEIFSAFDVGMKVNPITGVSVTNDGVKSLVLEGFSGGAHCCWTYWIVALGSRPALVTKISNQTGIAFEHQPGGRILLRTADGAFDYFDDLPHAVSPMPAIYLELRGSTLRDVSNQFVSEYDKRIAEAREFLTPERINTFRAGPQAASDSDTWIDAETQVLSIVLSYLYSRRDQQAWSALDEMWPAADRDRIAKLIVETRARGILTQTSGP